MAVNATIHGIDVSHWQSNINWLTVKEKGLISFAIAKATEGATWQDKFFKQNWQGMKQAGIDAGAYHVVRGTSTAQAQAENILTTLKGVGFNHTTDRFALSILRDDQLSPSELANRIVAVIGNLSAPLVKERVMIYTSPDWWNGHVNGSAYDFTQQPLWVAHWTTADQPRLPGNWSTWSIWHHSNKGMIPGIKGYVDLDRMQPLPLVGDHLAVNDSRQVTPIQDANVTSIPCVDSHRTIQPPLAHLFRVAINWITSFFQGSPGNETVAVQLLLKEELQSGEDLRLAAQAMNHQRAQGLLTQGIASNASSNRDLAATTVAGSPFMNITPIQLPLVAG